MVAFYVFAQNDRCARCKARLADDDERFEVMGKVSVGCGDEFLRDVQVVVCRRCLDLLKDPQPAYSITA